MSGDPQAGDGRARTAETVRSALERAGVHARNAASESVLAVRALLDAIALLQSGAPATSRPVLAQAAAWLERIAKDLSPAGSGEVALTQALAEALDAEIARWEQRAQEDADARAVLRAFLGVRELLWELGVRAPASATGSRSDADEAPRRTNPRRRRRVERVPVQG